MKPLPLLLLSLVVVLVMHVPCINGAQPGRRLSQAQGSEQGSAAEPSPAGGAGPAPTPAPTGPAESSSLRQPGTGPPVGDGGWRIGRASWYGTPKQFTDVYSPTRGGGEAAFGILEWGGCGYTNPDGTIAFPKENVASYSDQNADFAGSCGRCYEVKCKEGLVLGWKDQPVDFLHFYYFPKFANTTDLEGRSFPGNPAVDKSNVYVKCWDPNKSVIVHIIDICQCFYYPFGKLSIQYSCCGKTVEHPKSGQHEFDLSFWAYQQLAHPEYPEMMLYFRPVDCSTGQALGFNPSPISRTPYKDFPGTGWSFFAYNMPEANTYILSQGGEGVNGSPGACAYVSPGGGISLLCRNCSTPGYQPFKGANSLQLSIRQKESLNGTTKGGVPPISVTLGDYEGANYCNSKPYLPNQGGSGQSNGYTQFTIPMSTFDCTGHVSQDVVDIITLENIGSENLAFCVDEVSIL